MAKNKKIKKEAEVKEPLTKAEKIFTSIIVTLGVIAAIIVLIVVVPKEGKKDPVVQQFPYLEENHIVEEIEFNEFKSLLSSEDEFQLIIGHSSLEDATYYVVYSNELLKAYGVEKLYYINSSELSKTEKNYFKQELGLTNTIFEEMNLIYFVDGIIASQTFTGDLVIEGNCWDQLVKYFKECYGELEE